MTRIRTDNVFGTTTDNPLTAGATTMNSAGLANLAAVSSAEALIILDPNRVSGAPEIVVVTAHTGSATSATIVRGQFGTSARQHAAGTEWVHGPIASNASSYATAADDQGDYVPMNGWESYTPTLTNITIGTGGTTTAAYVRIGRTIHVRVRLLFGTGGLLTGNAEVSLPVPSATAHFAGSHVIGTCAFSDANGAVYPGFVENIGSFRMWAMDTSSTYGIRAIVAAAVPFTWAVNDVMTINARYEAAS